MYLVHLPKISIDNSISDLIYVCPVIPFNSCNNIDTNSEELLYINQLEVRCRLYKNILVRELCEKVCGRRFFTDNNTRSWITKLDIKYDYYERYDNFYPCCYMHGNYSMLSLISFIFYDFDSATLLCRIINYTYKGKYSKSLTNYIFK